MSIRVRGLVFMGIAWSALAGGCGATGTAVRGYPLYPATAGRAPGGEVARLGTLLPGGAAPGGGSTSFIKTVDGRDVSALDSLFELLPGCHVVTTEGQLVFADMNVSWSAQLPALGFAFPMKAGHEYLIVVQLREGMGGSGRVSVRGVEQDPTGKETRAFPPLPPRAAAQACRGSPGTSVTPAAKPEVG